MRILNALQNRAIKVIYEMHFWNAVKHTYAGAYPRGRGARRPPPADKCTKLSWCKDDIRLKDNLRA